MDNENRAHPTRPSISFAARGGFDVIYGDGRASHWNRGFGFRTFEEAERACDLIEIGTAGQPFVNAVLDGQLTMDELDPTDRAQEHALGVLRWIERLEPEAIPAPRSGVRGDRG